MSLDADMLEKHGPLVLGVVETVCRSMVHTIAGTQLAPLCWSLGRAFTNCFGSENGGGAKCISLGPPGPRDERAPPVEISQHPHLSEARSAHEFYCERFVERAAG